MGEKSYYTNYAINFFLYVISGKKFRTDLAKLFGCYKDKANDPLWTVSVPVYDSALNESQNNPQ